MKKELLVTVMVSFVNAMSLSVIIPVLYLYGKEFSMSDFQISLLLTLFSLAQFVATPVLGRLSDYYGRKYLLAISLFGTCLSNIMAFWAPTGTFLLIARVLDGITGGNNSIAQAIISDVTEPQDRAKAFGLFGGAFGMAFIIGPLISILLQRISLSAPFLASAVFAFIGTVMILVFLPETIRNKETKPLKISDLGFLDIVPALFRPKIGTILIINFVATLIFGVFQFGFQPYIVNVLYANSSQISMAVFLFGIVSVIMQVKVVPLLVEKLGNTGTLKFGFLGSAIILALYLLPKNVWVFLALTPWFGVFGFVFRPVLSALMSLNSKKEDQGVALGLMESYFGLATALGPLIGGLFAGISYGSPFILAAGVSLVGLVITHFKASYVTDHPVKKANF